MAIKRMKFERQLAKGAKQAAAVLPSPPPEETVSLAKDGIEPNRGNSNQQTLSDQGQAQVDAVGQELGKKIDGPLKVISSPAVRTEQTAQSIESQASGPVEHQDDPRLESWAQGNLEGKPRDLVIDQIRSLIRKNPGAKLPGQGSMSTRPGESFDDFRQRALSGIRGVMQQKANEPNKAIVVPTHSSVINLVHAWLANGAPDDLSITPEEMDRPYGPPGSVVALKPDENGKWSADELDLKSNEPIDPSAILLARHGMTPENKENYDHTQGAQQALATIAQHTKSMDFQRARAVAQTAIGMGHLSEPEVDSAIDDALPDAKQTAKLPMHQILGVAAAASPQKKAEYAPLIKNYFEDQLGSLPPDSRALMANHLSQIGYPPQQTA